MALGTSLLVNVLAVAALEALGGFGSPGVSLPSLIALAPLTASEWETNRALSAARTPALPAPGQFIDLPPDADRDPARRAVPPPARARYLAERDQSVERETVSRYADLYPKHLRVPQEKVAGRAGGGERGKAIIALKGREGVRGSGRPDRTRNRTPPPVAAPDPAERGEVAERARNRDRPGPAPGPTLPGDGEGGKRLEGEPIPNFPTTAEYERPEGGPSMDAFGQAPDGDETRLNARRHEYAMFWNSVKHRFEEPWIRAADRTVRERDPQERTFFFVPRTVILRLALDPAGQVMDLKILQSSNVRFFDALAVDTIRGQQPYPTPPPGLLGPDGSARHTIRLVWVPSGAEPKTRLR